MEFGQVLFSLNEDSQRTFKRVGWLGPTHVGLCPNWSGEVILPEVEEGLVKHFQFKQFLYIACPPETPWEDVEEEVVEFRPYFPSNEDLLADDWTDTYYAREE